MSSEGRGAAAPSPARRPLPGWVAAIHAVSRVLGVFSAGLIVLSVVVICQMVFVRAVLGQSSIWQTEFVTFSLVAATFLGAPYIQMTHGHVGVDVLPLILARRGRRLLHLAGATIALAFCLVFAYAAWPWWHEAWTKGLTTPSIWRARLWIPYLAVPVGLVWLCLQLVAEMVLVASDRQDPMGTPAGMES